MPVFIPVLLIAASVITAGAGGKNIIDSHHRKSRAKERYKSSWEIYEHMEKRFSEERDEAKSKFQELYKARLEAVKTITRAGEFLKRSKINERNLKEKFDLSSERLKEWKGEAVSTLDFLSGLGKSATAGLSTASAAYTAVSLFGQASTGTAINLLSGAAARSATLAALGGGSLAIGGGGMALGGAVLNIFAIGPGIFVSGLIDKSNAEKLETKIQTEVAKLKIAQAKMEKYLAEIRVKVRRVEEITRATIELTNLLRSLLDYSDPEKLEDAYKVYHLAKGLADLLDVKITDQTENLRKE